MRKAELGPRNETPWYRFTYSNYKQVGEFNLPHTVRIKDLISGAELIVNYDEFKVAPPLRDGIFTITPTPGIKIAPITEGRISGA